ncbi:hypothetical protein BpHYR1_013009 [Brachionus plicatilis]|uniref:Uncharacterized protein n=1 Tax=Brachionus plicatilis TaxID=10195 RepID=A0A3M7QG55_BRAPC|nr:hypothetical protein BpHYR1_013009 [Brachionus plicatilis]
MIDVINASNKFMQMIDKCVSGFFEDFGILRERYMNDSDINSIDIESFEINISNKGSRQKPKRKCFSGSSFNRYNQVNDLINPYLIPIK